MEAAVLTVCFFVFLQIVGNIAPFSVPEQKALCGGIVPDAW